MRKASTKMFSHVGHRPVRGVPGGWLQPRFSAGISVSGGTCRGGSNITCTAGQEDRFSSDQRAWPRFCRKRMN